MAERAHEPEAKTREALVHIYSEQCTGCGYCQLACSFAKTKSFGFSQALIDVQRVEGKERYQVGFLPGCDRCGICVRYCHFGVLRKGLA